MTPWLELCRAAVADVEDVLASMPTREERGRPIGRGKGGDTTIAVDAAAERAVLAHFDLPDVRIVSEEIGIKGTGPVTIVVDPIDGSQNAERGIPYFALCVAVAEGETMDDVVFGFVHDFGAGEEWSAVRGGGAFLDGKPLTGEPGDPIEFMSLEATRADLILDRLTRLAPLTDRVRVMGAQAITFCHLAAGRTDAVVCLKPSRSVDFAGAQLLIRERGFAIEAIDGPPVGQLPLDLRPHSRICAARNERLTAEIAAAVRS
jgi:myo-inositol-1(or 4)-monophosphatase